jgi:hypothetical protein
VTTSSASTTATGNGLLTGIVRRLSEVFRPPSIASVETFTRFLEERASLIAQKCAVDYCRGKTGLASYALFTEKPFLDAFDICRWEAFASVLGDLFIVAEGQLRPYMDADARFRLCDVFVGHYASVLKTLPAPVHRPQGWDDCVASFSLRMRATMSGDPQQALDVADHSAKRLFDTLPIHTRYRNLDEEVVYGAVRFRMIAVSQELQRRLRADDLVRELLKESARTPSI